MANRPIQVRIDDRVRLISAVLAGTDWPEKAHQRKGHRPHAHARATQKWVAEYKSHPAITAAQSLLDKKAPLEAFYAYILKLPFPSLEAADNPPWVPEKWNEHLRDFYNTSKIADLWKQDEQVWQKSQHEATTVIKDADFYTFLQPFVGQINEQLVYMPNISYPSDMAVGVRVGGELACIGHPRIAWGDNPPWPFDEDKGHVYSTSLTEYVRLLMLAYLRQNAEAIAPVTQKPLPVEDDFRAKHPTWGDQFTELVVPAIVALYLENHVSEQEAKAFILMEKKARGVTILPGVVSVLKRYLTEAGDGKYPNFSAYLPLFPGHLRIAKGISAL